jgi:endo-1,4-beta-xylanase
MRLFTPIPLIFIFAVIINVSLAVEDPYHQELRAELQSKYSLTGGSWVLSDNEQQTNNLVTPSNVIVRKEAWQGSEPFYQILELETRTVQSNAWDAAVRFTSPVAINEGDILLLVVWMRRVDVDEENNTLTHIYELTSDPWTKSLSISGTPPATWKQWLVPFEADINYNPNQSRYQINLGHLLGTIQIGGLAIINYGTKYTKDQLPTSDFAFDYDGREDGAQWRVDALARIEQNRTGALVVAVYDEAGKAVPNASVHIRMKQHHFGFGSAISKYRWYSGGSDTEIYREKVADLTGDGRTFSIVVLENALKWPGWERTDNPQHRTETANLIAQLVSYGMRVRGHNLVWPLWDHLPDDLERNKNNPTYIENRIYSHIQEEAGWPGIKGVLSEWDVINEMSHCFDLRDVFETEDIYTDWMNWAREADPDALLYINEYSIINNGGNDKNSHEKYREIIERLQEQGAPLDGIGIQGHFNTYLTPPAKVLSVLDQFAVYGKDISITEYDASGTPGEAAADYMRDILIAAYSHSSVRNFLMWGFWDGAHWHEDAPLFTRDWQLKPSGEMFMDYVFNKWWTDVSAITDANGMVSTRGFHGEHELTVAYGGKVISHHFNLLQKGSEIKTIQIRGETVKESIDDAAERYELRNNYPNPFNRSTKIIYTIPEDQHVRMAVYNLQGKLVAELQNGRQPKGAYELTFDARALASGIYLYQIEAGDFRQTKKMAYVK